MQKGYWQELLRSAYQNSLGAIKGKGVHSIIFPPLSTGIFKCPPKEALSIMMDTLVQSLAHDGELQKLQEVILVVWSAAPNAQDISTEWLAALDKALLQL